MPTHPTPPGIPDMSSIMFPYLCGGEALDIRKIKLEPKHYLQEDKSLNAQIWSVFPVERNMISLFVGEFVNPQDCANAIVSTAPGVYTPSSIAKTAPMFERKRIEANLVTLGQLASRLLILYGTHGVDGRPTPFATYNELAKRKAAKLVEPLPALIAKLTTLKEKGNSYYRAGEYAKAIVTYFYAMLDLYPWTGNAFLFTADDAALCGVLHLEQTLWLNLGISCLKYYESGQPDQFLFSARDCTEAIIQMRYATYKSLIKASARLYDIGRLINPGPYPPVTPDMSPREMRDTIVKDVTIKFILAPLLFQRADRNGTIAKASDHWAHRHCVTSHTGCGAATPLKLVDDPDAVVALRIEGETTNIFTMGIDDCP